MMSDAGIQPGKAIVLFAFAALAACTTAPAVDDASLESKIISLERDSWHAWRAQDAAFFESFLSDDHVEVAEGGPADKRMVVGFISRRACTVESYALSDFRFTRLSDTSAMLVYRARQIGTCGSEPIPSPTWATSIFVLRDGRWQNVLYQQLPEKPNR